MTTKVTSKISGAEVKITQLEKTGYWAQKGKTVAAYGKPSRRAKKWVTIGYFSTQEEMKESVAAWMKAADEKDARIKAKRAARNKARKEERATAEQTFFVGDVVYTSWGYDQTNVEYYRIVKRTKAYVWLQEIGRSYKESAWLAGNSIPNPFIETDAPVMKKKIDVAGGKEVAININSFISAWKWDGKELYESSYH